MMASGVMPGAKVAVREHRNATTSIWLGRVKMRWHELSERPRKPTPAPKKRHLVHKPPAANHPWRGSFQAVQPFRKVANRS